MPSRPDDRASPSTSSWTRSRARPARRRSSLASAASFPFRQRWATFLSGLRVPKWEREAGRGSRSSGGGCSSWHGGDGGSRQRPAGRGGNGGLVHEGERSGGDEGWASWTLCTGSGSTRAAGRRSTGARGGAGSGWWEEGGVWLGAGRGLGWPAQLGASAGFCEARSPGRSHGIEHQWEDQGQTLRRSAKVARPWERVDPGTPLGTVASRRGRGWTWAIA